MPADLALINGPVFTAMKGRPFVESLAVGDGRILYAGADAGLRPHVGAETDIIDLRGRMASPGFQDAHIHPGSSGIDMGRCSLHNCEDAGEAIETIARYAAANPSHKWLRGSGWSQDWFPRGCPSKEILDAVVPDRPAYLPNRDGHSGWVNSTALARVGIDATTPDPADGRIERNPDGSPQGTLHEGARYLVTDHLPDDTYDDLRSGMMRAQRYLLTRGITAWQDAHVDAETQRVYLSLAESGELLAHVAGALWWDRHRGIDQIEDIIEMAHQAAPGYEPVGVKLMLDGVFENFTASLLEPYGDGQGGETGNQGMDFIDPGELLEIVSRLDGLGLSCHFHAIGDRAVRNALDAIARARKQNGLTENRHHIAHLQIVHPDDIPRFRRLGVSANCQTLWACDGGYQTDLTKPFLGPTRTLWQYPFGSLLRADAHLAMGSDWDVSTPDIFAQADVAVTRSDISAPNEPPLNPSEALSLIDSLSGFTLGSAYVNHLDTETGSLEVGKLADLVVLDCNPFERERPAGTLVDLTMIGGRVVYERPRSI